MCAGSQSGTRSATQAILAQSLEPWTAEGTACPVPKAESSAAKGEARASWTTAAIHPCSLTNSGGTCAFLPAHLWQVVDRVYIQDSTQFEPSTTCPGAAANQSHSAELLLSSLSLSNHRHPLFHRATSRCLQSQPKARPGNKMSYIQTH